MKIRRERALAVISAFTAAAMLCACGGDGKRTASLEDMDLSQYPVKADAELTYWFGLGSNVSASVTNFGETALAKKLEEETGVKVKYIHPAQGQENESFGIMVASDEMADIVVTNWSTALGGPGVTINDKVIISLNDYLDEYAPNYKKIIESDAEIEKGVKNDDGQVFCFGTLNDGKTMTAGPMIRKDWLDDLGLEVPKTIDELENALRAFKEKKGADAPMSGTSGLTSYILMTLGTREGFYVDNGKVKYAPAEPHYKKVVERLAKWYKEGLLDQNYLSNDNTMLDANMLNGNTGFVTASIGSGMGAWLAAMEGKDDKFDLTAVPYVSFDGDDKPNMVRVPTKINQWSTTAISAKCKYPELAAKFLDYCYSEKGHMLCNFGIEGESYVMEDGYPKFTDKILNNPDGLSVSQALGYYAAAAGGSVAAYMSDSRYLEQYYQRPQQKEVPGIWTSQVDDNYRAMELPPLYYGAEESDEYADVVANLNKYRQEGTAAFVAGSRPMSEYESFVDGYRSLGLDRALVIMQSAYERYLAK